MFVTRRSFTGLIAAGCVVAPLGLAQEKKVSPAGTAGVTLGGQTIAIAYSRPFAKGRKIIGGLVPYGRVWRTGADDATSLKTPVNLEIGGAKVPAGDYTLYSLPSPDSWKLIVNKQTGQWGTEYDESKDLARIAMKKETLAAPVEEFTIEFAKKSDTSAELILKWEQTKLSVPVRIAG